MKKIKTKILLLLCLFSLSACTPKEVDTTEEIHIITSFYPVYLLAKEVTQGVAGITLSNMAQPQSGCLHDYTLSTKDMKLLAEGAVLLLSGGGMEDFLGDTLATFPELQVIDTGAGIPLLSASHDHGAEDAEGHGAAEEGNAHLWLSPTNAKMQVAQMVEALGEVLPAEASIIEANGARLMAELGALSALGEDQGEEIPVAMFHEGFDYFAQWFGLHPEIELFVEEYETPTAEDLAKAITIAKAERIRYFLTADDGGRPYAELLAKECGGEVIILDPLTTGDLATGDFMKSMTENGQKLAEIGTKEGGAS